jgi:hypothetical protein
MNWLYRRGYVASDRRLRHRALLATCARHMVGRFLHFFQGAGALGGGNVTMIAAVISAMSTP